MVTEAETLPPQDVWLAGAHALTDRRVTFAERPDILITAEREGLTLSWLKGDDDDAAIEMQKQKAAARFIADVEARENGVSPKA